jgi:hypothetical protein
MQPLAVWASAASPETSIGEDMHRLFRCRNLIVALAFVATLALGATAANAQLVGDLEANIPFTFQVDNTRLPAGEYYMRPFGDLGDNVLEIESANKTMAVMVVTENAESAQIPKDSELTFDKIGNQYFLRGIVVQDSKEGYALAPSKQETKAKEHNAKVEIHKLMAKHHKAKTSKA